MVDARIKKLANSIINYSCALKPGEHILIEGYDQCLDLVEELVNEAYKAGGHPHVWLRNYRINRALQMHCNEEQLKLEAAADAELMKHMDAYVGIRAPQNSNELSDVPPENGVLNAKVYFNTVHNGYRIPHTKWVAMRYPSPAMAQSAGMSQEAFEDYYFDVCCLDYARMDRAMDPLKELLEKTDKVRITGPGTDITFSIKGMPAIKCSGNLNLPDGEVFTAPLVGSINGKITFNTPSAFEGFVYENVCLTYENGYLASVTANDTERINKIFARDEGTKSVGEFAIGVHPYITKVMKDTLFDEKIAGSFHFTPGNCYDSCDNGNKSCIHWDLVCIQTPEFGGGEMYFDDVLVRKDGLFVLPELEVLNPENLK